MKYQIFEKNAFNIIGIKEEFSVRANENLIGIPKMWKAFNENGTVGKLISLNNGAIKGVLGVCIDKVAQVDCPVIDYWIATAFDGEKTPDEFLSLAIPASKWAVFEVHGPMPDAMQEAWKQIYSEWFSSSGYKHVIGVPELEVYTEEDSTSPDLYSEIWIAIQ
ncbi:GyrI-like domain-containing protein [Bacillus massiliigorillae]|uniref:GyrI-like domain-containing protein n=1 Tax=Bacillus massiliigorillae TaxID=1243664 RepID=UPI0003A4E357|nr:GyrI-like domain-containing protein [Bacillus massiliigorillae]